MNVKSQAADIPPELVARFRTVALERTQRIEDAWLNLTQQPDDAKLVARLKHELHTLKGDSQIVGFLDVNLLCHKLEDLIAVAELERFAVRDDLDLVVTMAVRFINVLLRKRAGQACSGIDLAGFVHQVDEVLREAQAVAPAPPGAGATDTSVDEAVDRLSPKTEAAIAAAATRVYLEQLGTDGLRRARLYKVWRELAEIPSGLGSEPLKSRLARHIHGAKQLAHDLGKLVQVTLRADYCLIRDELAGALDTALLHALRNAVDHGIEPSEERTARGKPPIASIHIEARTSGQVLTISVEDDGRGVDQEAVVRRAVELGHLAAGETRTEAQILELLFEPGFSTRETVGSVSGRGVGLDAARAALHVQHGSMRLTSRAGQGTLAVLRVPHISRFTEVVHFPSTRDGLILAVPASFRVSRVESTEGSLEWLDPLAALHIAPGDPAPERTTLRVERGGSVIHIIAGGSPRAAKATRLCVTADDFPVEVVAVGGQEALLLHRPLVARGEG